MAAAPRISVSDPSSYSEPEKCQLLSLHLDINIDFSTQTLGSYANLTFQKKVENLENLVLDVRDLTIDKITLLGSGKDCQFEITNPHNVTYGSKLTIKLDTAEKSFTISIKYRTSPAASALQWLRPEQTAGKRHPYLFSQCQAIHARSLFPCQDTPAVKFTYTAQVRAPKEITVLMSAVREGAKPAPDDSSDLVTTFTMSVPIPSYLVAIVAGDLESRQIGPRSRVWSEKELVDAAAFEFSETETMLQTAEQLMGPYVWKVYDLLVLPPSFPYGGMENPCLTFVTPTILAGDRSLADVIAHEISHSWTGNLVTNKTFEDFWLNEGHTMFIERLILQRMRGELHRQLHAHEGFHDLQATVDTLTRAGNESYTRLVPDLKGVDPDDAFSIVPYEKGFSLLYHLQTILGGPAVFEAFLRAYIENFKYKSISTDDWKQFLYSYFSSEEDHKKLNTVDWQKWLYGVGMPPYQPNLWFQTLERGSITLQYTSCGNGTLVLDQEESLDTNLPPVDVNPFGARVTELLLHQIYDLSLAEPSRVLSRKWIEQPDDDLNGFSPEDISNLPSFIIREFLSQLFLSEPPLSLAKVKQLEKVYSFNRVRNSEIRFRWLRLCVLVKWEDAIPHILAFLNEQGRMKFVRPLYRDLYAWEEARPKAIANFLDHRQEMHNTTAGLVAKDLKLED